MPSPLGRPIAGALAGSRPAWPSSPSASRSRSIGRFLRLAENALVHHVRKLLGDRSIQQIVCNDPDGVILHDIVQARDGLLDHGCFAIQLQHLFGAGSPATRPKPGSASTCKDYGCKWVAGLRCSRGHTSPSFSTKAAPKRDGLCEFLQSSFARKFRSRSTPLSMTSADTA